ncbi:ParM/StbA family protein [Leptothoe spongobia]|uniref:ParM/StbA family protein n=1 Tax=Leptothoe spongobia TAU-MAC 1115 TaxID=1967444 RepID=A0A947DGJ8_9CYAN|nr:ParM/StbA family protein [Leptothoe spongobia]MBT9316264.1 ParM/StbA family protein [Leptothoe spongobia TAU-MAC 1115]
MDMKGAAKADKASSAAQVSGLIRVGSFDPGNTFTKFCTDGHSWKMPSFVKELDPDVDEFDPRLLPAGSAIVDVDGKSYAVGEIAESGGDPAFVAGKENIAHILFFAAIAPIIKENKHPVIGELRFLVPDARKNRLNALWNSVADKIKGTTSVVINGEKCSPRVDDVRFVPEGVPVFQSLRNEQVFQAWLAEPRYTDVVMVDVGGGDTTLSVFDLRTGMIDYERGRVLDKLGVKALGARIASTIQSQCHGTPEVSEILKALHHGDPDKYIYASSTDYVPFGEPYEKAASKWRQSIAKELMASGVITARLAGCIFFGGGAYHCRQFANAIKNVNVIVMVDKVDAQMLNVLSMQVM